MQDTIWIELEPRPNRGPEPQTIHGTGITLTPGKPAEVAEHMARFILERVPHARQVPAPGADSFEPLFSERGQWIDPVTGKLVRAESVDPVKENPSPTEAPPSAGPGSFDGAATLQIETKDAAPEPVDEPEPEAKKPEKKSGRAGKKEE